MEELAHESLDLVTGAQSAAPPDARARQALDKASERYGADRVVAIPQSPETIRDNRAKGYWITWGYVRGPDGKIDSWIEGP